MNNYRVMISLQNMISRLATFFFRIEWHGRFRTLDSNECDPRVKHHPRRLLWVYAELVRLRLRSFQKRLSLDVWWIEIVFCVDLAPPFSGMYSLSSRAALSSCDLSAAFPLRKLSSFKLRLFSLSLFRKFVSPALDGLVLPFWSSNSSSNLLDLLSWSACLLLLCLLLSLASMESSLRIASRLLSAFISSTLREFVSSALLATASSSLRRSASLELRELGEPVTA